MKREMIVHPLPPLYDESSTMLILGSFPSIKTREMGFFYGHPQNRFWRVVATVFREEVPMSVEERRDFLIRNHIAAWDVIHSCTIEGSSDSSIRDVVANDLSPIIEESRISRIFVNGRTAEKMYNKYIEPRLGVACISLPSTSPANAAWSFERLVEEWSIIKSD